ncbi:zinc finger BED domain-containing protein 4-like [Aphis craccivora]|uniref:Zinc finger BED domain-containing protein 4-like n=1 Tax=Aphis craccivora TaxID=307492 RepID=A0A6G0VQW0_APHCR|nr:zinc finger BED domain-containing protein 4-like [Aphis craccivora]
MIGRPSICQPFTDVSIRCPLSCVSRVAVLGCSQKLRTPTVSRMVKSLEPNSPKAILDVPTRWESTYDMLLRLRRLRKVCIDLSETYKELCMNNTEWNMIDNAIKSFEPAKIATVKDGNAKGGIAKNQNVHKSRKTVTHFLTTISTQNNIKINLPKL